MTREEAIEYLKRADTTVGQTIKSRTAEALEMAIKALQTENCEIECTEKPCLGKLCQYHTSCNDAISRQAVLDACDQSINILDATGRIRDLPSVNQQKVGRWIPCKERLPEFGKVVLWCNEYGSVFTSAITYVKDIKGNQIRVGKHGTKMLAWMPLPEPYMEEGDDMCKNCEYYHNPDYTRCHECDAESEDKK